MPLLKCEDLTLSYNSNPIISNLDFSVSKGDYVCILGENGVGKSTIIKGILGFIKPSGGSISFSDGLTQNEIGYLPQQSDIQKDFPASVYEVVLSGTLNKCGLYPFYKKEHKKLAMKNMELLEISHLKTKCFQELSGGQQQRVLLARALCATGKLLVLDEPVSGLDPIITNDLYSIINDLNKKHNISIIMVSHDINGAIKNASHILHLNNTDSFFGTVNDYIRSDCIKNFTL